MMGSADVQAERDTSSQGTTGWRGGKWLAWFAVCIAILCGGQSYWRSHSGLLDTPFRSSIQGWDHNFYYFWLRAAVIDHTVDFTNEVTTYNSWEADTREWVLEKGPRTPRGLIANKYPIGWAVAGAPWFLMADLLSATLNLLGKRAPLDGWSAIYQGGLMIGQGLYAVLSLWFACRIVARFVPMRHAVTGTFLTWLASPLIIYQTAELALSHNFLFFAVTGAYYFALRLSDAPEKARFWIASGVFGGLAMITRYQGALLLIYPGILGLRIVIGRPRLWREAGWGVAFFLLVLAPQLIAWKLLYGSFFLYTYTGESFDWLHPHLWEVAFSPFHGWFNWHPAMAIGTAGFLWWAGRERSLAAWCFLASFAAYYYTNASWDCWWFGASFGARAFEGPTLFVMLGMAYLFWITAHSRPLFCGLASLLLVLILWNMNLVWVTENGGNLPWEEPVSMAQRLEISRRFWKQRL